MFGATLAELRKYDIIASNGDVVYTYECKRDRLTQETGNVAVEHKALLHSQAMFWVYMIDGFDQLLKIGRERLQEILKTTGGREKAGHGESSEAGNTAII